MKVIEDSPNKLVIVNDDSGFAWLLRVLFLICVVWCATMYMDGSYLRIDERFWGLVCGAGIFLLANFAVYKRTG